MPFTLILALLLVGVLIGVIITVRKGLEQKNKRMIVAPIILFVLLVCAGLYGLLYFITSM